MSILPKIESAMLGVIQYSSNNKKCNDITKCICNDMQWRLLHTSDDLQIGPKIICFMNNIAMNITLRTQIPMFMCDTNLFWLNYNISSFYMHTTHTTSILVFSAVFDDKQHSSTATHITSNAYIPVHVIALHVMLYIIMAILAYWCHSASHECIQAPSCMLLTIRWYMILSTSCMH